MFQKSSNVKIYGGLVVALLIIFTMIFLTLPVTAATATPTTTPSPTAMVTPTPTRRIPTPTPTRRTMPTPRLRSGVSASTRPATNIRSSTVTFSANISSGGHQIVIWYEYWEAANPTQKMSTPERSYSNIATIDTQDVSGLNPSTPYLYRVVMDAYGYGTSPLRFYGKEEPFTTLPYSPTPLPTIVPASYIVSYGIQSDWGNGATISVTITNKTSTTVTGWTLAWSFPGNQKISTLWNGTYTQNGTAVAVKDGGSNTNIPANSGSVNFGFNISYTGTNAKPTSFTLNDAPCLVQ